jgi:eukaryotic-like serine/threonine-protein kinase
VSDQKICPTCGTEYPLSERFCPRDGTALRSASATADLLGSVVAERYHIIKKLGEGGMGTVYLAEHVKMGRKSALKVMNPGMNTDPDAIARFNREASNASRLSHPNICAIYDFGETPDGLIYLAMEFIEGKALSDLIEADGSLTPARAASIVHQTADALQVAHDAGIVHRDLKPDNIMVTKSRDGSDLVKVVDFGIAKASSSDAQKVTKTGLVVGTPEYMSPEQLAGDKLDGRSDIYSLGLVAFNCLTGKLPFPSETAQEAMIMRLTDRPRTLAELRPDFVWPAELQTIMDKGLARDAEDRYQSAAQFGRDFGAAAAAMTPVRASSGATIMVEAQKQGTPVSVDAVTKAIPATRVSDNRDHMATPAQSARPVVAEKKSMVPLAAGGGALAVAALVAWLWLGKSETPMALDPTPSSVASTPDGASAGLGQTDTTPPPAGDAIVPLGQPVTPERQQPRQDTRSSTAGNASPATFTSSATPNASQVLADWRVRLEALAEETDVARAGRVAREALREIEPLTQGASGIQLEDGRYLMLLAHNALDSKDEVCRLGALVAQSRLLMQAQRDLAAFLRQNQGCP